MGQLWRVCAVSLSVALLMATVDPGSAPVAQAAVPGTSTPALAPLRPSDPVASIASVTWLPCGLSGTATSRVYLPNITKTLGGPAGWVTPFYVQNVGNNIGDVVVAFYRFSDGSQVACRTVRGISPGEVVTDNPNTEVDLPDNTQFAVVVTSYGAPVVATVNQLQGSGPTTEALSYSGVSAGATTVFLPNVTRRFYGYDVPFIVQNMGTATASVSAAFVSFDGAQHFTTAFDIAPGRSGVVDPDYTPGLVDGTQYAVTLHSTQPVGVVVNAHNEALGPVAFSHNGLGAGGTTLWAPYAVKAGPSGLFSPIVVQNLGATPVDATLSFGPLNSAGAAQTFVLAAIPAGGSRAFDPRFTLGTTTPCASAAASCLGPGEFSLKITAPTPVAAVVLPNSDSTAAAYVAVSNPDASNYLPVVQRTIGGPSGWNGTIYLQSATATSATVFFHRIPDYVVDGSTFVTLTPGVTQRIDPRQIPGLRENTEYAVVAQSPNGAIASIVFDQAGTGGDASMIYEGFALPAPASPLVRGTVSGPSGPVAGVFVEIVVAGEVIDSGITDQNGQYAISVLSGNAVRVRFGPPEGSRLAAQYYPGVNSSGEATIVNVSTADVQGINATLVSSVYISGRVTTQLGGAAVPGARVFAYRTSCSTCGSTLSGQADASGAFRVTVPPGTYRLFFQSPPGAPNLSTWYPAGSTFAAGADVIANSDVSNIVGALPPGYRITGTVRGGAGAPVPGATVSVRLGGGATCCSTFYSTTTDLSGQYVAVVPSGAYRVSFVPQYASLATAWYGGATSFLTATDITVAGADLSGIDATLAPGSPIFGTTSFNNQVSSGVTVQVYLANAACCNNIVFQGVSDVYGDYQVDVAPGTYRLRFVAASGGVTASKWYSNATSFGTATDVVVNGQAVRIDGSLP